MMFIKYTLWALGGVVMGSIAPIVTIVALAAYIVYLRVAAVAWRGMLPELCMLSGAVLAAVSGLLR